MRQFILIGLGFFQKRAPLVGYQNYLFENGCFYLLYQSNKNMLHFFLIPPGHNGCGEVLNFSQNTQNIPGFLSIFPLSLNYYQRAMLSIACGMGHFSTTFQGGYKCQLSNSSHEFLSSFYWLNEGGIFSVFLACLSLSLCMYVCIFNYFLRWFLDFFVISSLHLFSTFSKINLSPFYYITFGSACYPSISWLQYCSVLYQMWILKENTFKSRY